MRRLCRVDFDTDFELLVCKTLRLLICRGNLCNLFYNGQFSILELILYHLYSCECPLCLQPHMREITDAVKTSVPLPNEISGYFCNFKYILKLVQVGFFGVFLVTF